MKILTLTILLAVVACSSSKERSASEHDNITNASFKKERPLKNSEVADFYTGNAQALSPALHEETLDRHSKDELSRIAGGNDPLVDIAVKCTTGDYNAAFASANAAFDKYQKVATYWNLIANCHLNQGSYRKALLFYNKALEVSRNYVPALNNIGVLYARQGQDQKALVAFEKASSQSKFSKTPRYNMAKLMLRYGLADQALVIFRSLLQASPQDVDLLNSTASAYFLAGDYRQAAAHYGRIPAEVRMRPEIGLNYAWTLKLLGDQNAASKVFGSLERPEGEEQKNYWNVVAAQLGEKR